MPNHYYNHSRRDGRSLAGPYTQSPYPGIDSYVQPPPPVESGMLPALGPEAAESALAAPALEAEAVPKAGGLLGGLGNLANMDQIKGIIDRMGGIDGIVNSMGKVQKVVEGFQQMAPMVKLVMGNFGKKKGSGALAAEEDAALYKPKSRKKRRRPSNQRRKSPAKKRRKSAPTSVKRRRT